MIARVPQTMSEDSGCVRKGKYALTRKNCPRGQRSGVQRRRAARAGDIAGSACDDRIGKSCNRHAAVRYGGNEDGSGKKKRPRPARRSLAVGSVCGKAQVRHRKGTHGMARKGRVGRAAFGNGEISSTLLRGEPRRKPLGRTRQTAWQWPPPESTARQKTCLPGFRSMLLPFMPIEDIVLPVGVPFSRQITELHADSACKRA